MKIVKWALLLSSLAVSVAHGATAAEDAATEKYMNAQMNIEKSVVAIELQANPSLVGKDGFYKNPDTAPLHQLYLCVDMNSAGNQTQKCVSRLYADVLKATMEEASKENLAAGVLVNMMKKKDPSLFEPQQMKAVPALEACGSQLRAVQADGHYSGDDVRQAIVLGKVAGDLFFSYFNQMSPGFCK